MNMLGAWWRARYLGTENVHTSILQSTALCKRLLTLYTSSQAVATLYSDMPFEDEPALIASLLSGSEEASKLVKAIAAAGAGNASEWDQQALSYSPKLAVAAGLFNRFSAGSHFVVHSVGGGNFDDYALADETKLAAFKARLDDALAAGGG